MSDHCVGGRQGGRSSITEAGSIMERDLRVAIHSVACTSRRGIGKARPRLVHCSDLKRAALMLRTKAAVRDRPDVISFGHNGPNSRRPGPSASLDRPSRKHPRQSPSESCLQMTRLPRLDADSQHTCALQGCLSLETQAKANPG